MVFAVKDQHPASLKFAGAIGNLNWASQSRKALFVMSASLYALHGPDGVIYCMLAHYLMLGKGLYADLVHERAVIIEMKDTSRDTPVGEPLPSPYF